MRTPARWITLDGNEAAASDACRLPEQREISLRWRLYEQLAAMRTD